MSAYFAVIGSTAFTTRKFVNNIRTQAIGYFIFELEKNGNTCWGFKKTLILRKGKVLTDTSF